LALADLEQGLQEVLDACKTEQSSNSNSSYNSCYYIERSLNDIKDTPDIFIDPFTSKELSYSVTEDGYRLIYTQNVEVTKSSMGQYRTALTLYADDNEGLYPANQVSGTPDVLPTTVYDEYLSNYLATPLRTASQDEFMYLASGDQTDYVIYVKLPSNGEYYWINEAGQIGESETVPTLNEVATPNTNTSTNTNSSTGSSAEKKARDAKVRSDLGQYRTVLVLYSDDNSSVYPTNTVDGTADPLPTVGELSKYLSRFPTSPNSIEYQYLTSSTGDDYVIYGWLENTAKYYSINTEGYIYETDAAPTLGDTDSDGLSDTDEVLYGTEVDNPDTDGDGYLDGEEVANGYNPNGEGLLNS
ncbi:MAG: hypothetical protein V1719_00470, partial [Patescibacteria group bacterium]